MKAACYCLTRNLYKKLIPSLNSLLINGNIDKVFLVIEDDSVGYKLPMNVECINIQNQKFFSKDGPNFTSGWTYMILLRVALPYILPDYVDKVLSLDVDTLVLQDVGHLWDIDMGKNYIAGVPEVLKSTYFTYINAGVMLMDLNKMRVGDHPVTDKLIDALNTDKYEFPEQDCINSLCNKHIHLLSADYNVADCSAPTNNPIIVHYAGRRRWYDVEPLVQDYKDPCWEV